MLRDKSTIHEQCWKATADINDIKKCIKNGHSILIIIRGLPGSGKTTLANELISECTDSKICSADSYFMIDGVYKFDVSKLSTYHQFVLRDVKNAFSSGTKLVIVDNTNIYYEHVKPFVMQAVKFAYEIYFVEPATQWKRKPSECAQRNLHGVDVVSIQRMCNDFQQLSLEDMMKPCELNIVPTVVDEEEERLISAVPTLFSTSLASSSKDKCPKKIGARQSAADLYFRNELFYIFDVATQTSDAIRLICQSGIKSDEYFRDDDLVSSSTPYFRTYSCLEWERRKVDRTTQTWDNGGYSDLFALAGLFPDERPSELAHSLDLHGLYKTIPIFVEMGSRIDIYGYSQINSLSDCMTLSATTSVNLSVSSTQDQDVLIGTNTVLSSIFHRSAHESSRLIPSSSKQSCDPEPIRSGYYRMELSIDMIHNLLELFGDEATSVNKTYVDLPLTDWEIIYHSWRGPPTSTSGGYLHGTSKSIAGKRYQMSIARQLNLRKLQEEFSCIDGNRILECYIDNGCAAEATRFTLKMFSSMEDNFANSATDQRSLPSVSSDPDNVLQSGLNVTAMKQRKTTASSLKSVQATAMEIRDEINDCIQRRKEAQTLAANAKNASVKQHYIAKAVEIGTDLHRLKNQADLLIASENDSKTFVDVHFMGVLAAIRLVEEKLSSLDRPPEMRNNRSDLKLCVITGYGRTSGAQPKIKPALIGWLKQKGYEFSLSNNQGEIIVNAK